MLALSRGKAVVVQTPGDERVAVRAPAVRREVRGLIGQHIVHIDNRTLIIGLCQSLARSRFRYLMDVCKSGVIECHSKETCFPIDVGHVCVGDPSEKDHPFALLHSRKRTLLNKVKSQSKGRR